MTENVSLDMYAGSLVWWNATLTDSKQLQDSLKALGVSHTFREVKPDFALLQAVTSQYYSHPSHHKGQLIRKAKAGPGQSAVVVVREELADDGNKYESTTRFCIDHDTYEVTSDTADTTKLMAVQQEASKYRGKVLGREVGTGISNILERLGCTKLRDGAKIYFVPSSLSEFFDRIANEFSFIKWLKTNCPVDADTAAGIADNATESLRSEFASILEEIQTIDSAVTLADPKQMPTLAAKRSKLINKLDVVRGKAKRIDDGFRGLIDIASQIDSEIESAMALAVLATITN